MNHEVTEVNEEELIEIKKEIYFYFSV